MMIEFTSRRLPALKTELKIANIILAGALIALAFQPLVTRAANIVMSGNDASGVSSFNSGANWTGGAAPVSTSTYQTAGFLLRTPANSTSITFAGSSLEVQSGGNLRDKTSSATITINNFILDNGGIFDMAANGGTLAGKINLSGGMAYISVGSNELFTCSSLISGSGGFYTFNAVSSGAGTNVLTSANTFSGGITINGGTLQANNTGGDSSTPLGSGDVTVNTNGILVGGGLDAFGYYPGTAPANIYINGGTVTELSTSNYRLTIPNITFNGGTLTSPAANTGDASGNYSLFGVGVPTVVTTLSNKTTAIMSARKISLQQNNQSTGTTIFQTATGNVTGGATPGVDLLVTSTLTDFSGSVSSLAKSGPGVMALDANNSYSGGTIISNGTLQLGTAGDVASLTSPLGTGSVTDNATLSFASGQPLNFSTVISGTGSVLINNGMAILAAANSYSGGTIIANGTLLVSNATGSATGSGNVTVNSGGILGGGGSLSGNVTVSGKTFPGAASTAGVTNTMGGNLTYTSGAQSAFNLNTSATGAGNDQIVLSGANSLLNCGGVSVGIMLTGASLEQVNDYPLFTLPNGSTISNTFNGVPVWLGTMPANAASYSIVTLSSKVVLHFASSGTTNLAAVTNLAASNVAVTTATLNGQLLSSGGQFPTVMIYYGGTDGGTNPANWASSVSLGLQSGAFASAVSNLAANTKYYFAAAASNSAGTAWARPSQSFTTLPLNLAVVTNLPASNIQGNSAILGGQVLSTGNQTPNITIYYGPSNGGTNAAAWANNIYLGQQSGGFAVTATGLSTNTTYYYSATAVNNSGTAWATPPAVFTTLPTAPAASVLTYHNDNARTGANTNETLLTPATVNTNNFGLLIKYVVDGFVYAQPLYVPNLAIPGQGTHNVVFVATEHNSLYAFDADNNAGANGGLLWHTNIGVAPLSNNHEFGDRYNNNNYIDLTPEVGITGTPVIDPISGLIYVDVLTREVTTVTNYIHRIHAYNIATGAEQPFSPVLVSASVPGTGVGGNGSVVPFNAQQQGQRPAMTLAGGNLYIAYGSFADTDPYHGWVLGFNATNLQRLNNYTFNTTPNATIATFGANAGEGALWMGGNGLCVDANNNLYFETGNGSFSANTGGGDYGDSFVKLSTTNGLAVADYFTPYNQLTLANNDTDLGSGGAILLPDAVGSVAHPHLMVGGGKEGKVYLLDRDNMGHFNSGGDTQTPQAPFSAGTGSFFGSPAYFNFKIYYQGVGGAMKTFNITNGQITTTASSTAPTSFNGKGITPSISANGTRNAIAWAIQTDGSSPSDTGSAVLHAYNATNLALELYNSSQNLARDNPGAGVKYTVPTVANGSVFVGAQYALSIYGVTSFLATPTISPNGSVFTNSVMVTLADATPGAAIYYTLDGTAPTTNSIFYAGPFLVTTTLNLQAIAIKSGAANSGTASASFINTATLGNGLGLMGQYWSNTTSVAFTNISFAIAPTLVRTDAVVNFIWTTNGPATSIGKTNFTARWTGSVQPQYSETYTFSTVADDGVRLWVNGQLLVNAWTTQSAAVTNSSSITLNAQQLYTIQLDYFQSTSSAVAELFWSSPSTAPAIVPQTQLYPYTNPPPTVVLSSPTNGSTYTGSASVTLGANADAPYNPISKVDFYANGSLLGTLSNSSYAPLYGLTATGLNAGAYTLTAVATDGSGLRSTSAPVNITVTSGSGVPYGLTTIGTTPAFLSMPTTFNGTLPALLSQTGAYSNTTNRTPAGGLIPYMPNTPLWSDAAVKSRYLAIPNSGGPDTPDRQISFVATNSWTFPAGTVFVKNFDLVVDETNPSVPLRRLETRLLVRDINGAVYGVTYRWRADNSDAGLLATSLSEDISITNASGVRTQTWYYPSPADCLTCHTLVANYVLGLNTRQLNGSLTYPATGNTDNQLRTLNRLGLFYPAFDEAQIANFSKLSALTNLSAPLQERARSYLDANCAQCHQPGGTGITFDARYDTPLANQNITNYPAAFSLGYDHADIVKAKDIWRSVLLYRINTNDATIKMPTLARNLIDTNAVQVITDWINSLPGLPALAPPAIVPNGGMFNQPVSVTLQPPDTNASLYYTLDQTLPTTNSFLYTAPFVLSNSVTLTVNAFEAGFDTSVGVSALFTVQSPPYFTSVGYLPNGQFQLGLSGMAGRSYVLQASTNLINWIPINTNVPTTNFFQLIDPGASNFPYRFYRTLEQ